MGQRLSASVLEDIINGTGDAARGVQPARGFLYMIKRTVFGTVAASGFAVIFALGVAFKQWLDQPIVIMPFTIDAGTNVAGISATALADQTKAYISAIYADSGELFETRKLGEPTAPLNIQLGTTGIRLQDIARALNLHLSAAEVKGRIAPDGDKLLLQWTTVSSGDITVGEYPIEATEASPLTNIDKALACLALRIVAGISPDVAANYLHKQDEASEEPVGTVAAHPCIVEDDAELYSKVSKDDALPIAARIDALVGLSVHFSYSHQFSEELTMALAASHLSSQWLSCDDPTTSSTHWSRFTCRIRAFRPFSDKNRRAAIAAGMQLGAAYSDYAAAAPTLGEMQELRARAIEAYEHVIQVDAHYAPAFNSRGLQQGLLGQRYDARESFQRSLEATDSAPARLDRAFLEMHGRAESYDDRHLGTDELAAAETDLRRAIELSPDYWDAHAGLGYALYLQGKLREAVNVVEVAVQHDPGNRPLRRLLGTVYVGLCRFDAAHANYQEAYEQSLAQPDAALAWDLAADWGDVLQRFGLAPWAFIQEQNVLAAKPDHPMARALLGSATIALSEANAAVIHQGLAELKTAVEADASRSDTVLNAYLVQLNMAQFFGDAVAAYEEWSRNGFVPPVAAPTLAAAVIQPVKPRSRLSYARALVETGRWADALRELEVLAGAGITPSTSDVTELQLHAASAGADSAALARIQALQGAPASTATAAERMPCTVAPSTSPILLTGTAL